MKFIMEIELGNAGMSEPEHLFNALKLVAGVIGSLPVTLDEIPSQVPVRDENGNKVGFYGVRK
jgi:hypothetical protein